MDYTPYLQLKPLQTDLDSGEILDQYNRQKAAEDAAMKAKRKAYMDSAKRIADYQSKFKVEDVQYHFNDEMMRIHDVAQKELYDIHLDKERMRMSGLIDPEKLRELNAKQSALMTIPNQIKLSFDSFNNVIVDYDKNKGKKGGYDDILNQDLIADLYGIMNDKSWRFDENTREFVFKNPKDATEKRMSPGQFMMNPTIYGQLKGFVDTDAEEKRLVDKIGAETTKYITKDNGYLTTRKSKAVDRRHREEIYNMIASDLEDKNDLLEKVEITKGLTKDQYIKYIMDVAGIKEDISTMEGRPPSDFGAGNADDYYKANFNKTTTERYSLWNDDQEQPGLGEYEIKNYLAIPESRPYNITPQSLVILSPEEAIGKGGTMTVPTEYTVNRIQQVRQDIPGFRQTGIGEVPVYNGDLTYRVKYIDEQGEESVKTIEKGDVVPSEVFNGEFELQEKSTGKGFFGFSKTVWIEPTSPDYFEKNSESIPMAFGVGKISGNPYKIAIPITDENKKAYSTINAETQKIKSFKKTGIVNDYMQRRESGEFYDETNIPAFESDITQQGGGLTLYANKTVGELMEMDPDLTEDDARIMANKSLDELEKMME